MDYHVVETSWKSFMEFKPIPGYDYLTVSRIAVDSVAILLIYLTAWLINWSVQKFIIKRLANRRNNIDQGRLFAVKQITRYIIYVIAFTFILDRLNVGSIIFTSFAGLFVGIGLGLQQTFSDLICGLILLIESSVKVGDFIEIESTTGRVSSIGIRTSSIETRNGVNIIVPNHKLIADNVINWSNNLTAARFHIQVGVDYDTDVQVVKSQLIEAALKHADVVKEPEEPLVIFKNFGESNLDFEIYFWTKEIWNIDIVKSDIRFEIDRLFRQSGIKIAYPHREIKINVENLQKINGQVNEDHN